MTQPQADRGPASIATRGSGRPALGMGMTGTSVWASVYGQVVQATAYDLPSNAVGTPCSAWHPAQDAMRNGEAGCESQPQRSHGSIGRLGTIGYPTSDSH